MNPKYYICQTLLASAPDINRRTIYDRATHEVVCSFNDDMKPWTKEMEREMLEMLRELEVGKLLGPSKFLNKG